MHIPDGFLTPPVWLTLDAISLPAVGWVARRTRRVEQSATDHSRIPLLGVMGAFVFAAQMVNFPVALGASGHLLGGTLLAVILGPSAAALTMTAILVLQALLFQDGGVLALGANVFNMAIAGVAAGYAPLQLFGRSATTLFAGGCLSVLASGSLALWQLSLSGVALSDAAVGIALALFLATGFIEGAITVAAFRAICRLSPGAIPERSPVSFQARAAVAMLALLLVTGGAWMASAAPDGLQHLAAKVGLEEHGVWTAAPFAGYELSGVGPGWLQKSAAGLIGVVCIYAVCALGGKRR
jgi:cobalt/nickel transport system permease protein